MKKILSIGIIVGMLLLSACTNTVNLEVKSVSDILLNELSFSENLSEISKNVQIKRYGLDEEIITDAAGYAGTKAVVDEIAVFKTTDTEAVIKSVNAHIDSQIEGYSSYGPDQVPKLEDAVIETVGDCVIVCVSESSGSDVLAIIESLSK